MVLHGNEPWWSQVIKQKHGDHIDVGTHKKQN